MNEVVKEILKAFAVAAATACGTAAAEALLKPSPPAATTAGPKPKRSSVKRRHGKQRER